MYLGHCDTVQQPWQPIMGSIARRSVPVGEKGPWMQARSLVLDASEELDLSTMNDGEYMKPSSFY